MLLHGAFRGFAGGSRDVTLDAVIQLQVPEDVAAAAGAASIAAPSISAPTMLPASMPKSFRPTVKSAFRMAVPLCIPHRSIADMRTVMVRLSFPDQAGLPHKR